MDVTRDIDRPCPSPTPWLSYPTHHHGIIALQPHSHGQGRGEERALARARDGGDSGARVPAPGQGRCVTVLMFDLTKRPTNESHRGHHHPSILSQPTHPPTAQAKTLMSLLEEVSERSYNAYFVDLFVRVSNALAISMYKRFGYSVYRRVLGYYSGEEDAFGTCLVGAQRRCVYIICIMYVWTHAAFYQCAPPPQHRYAKSAGPRPRQEVRDTHDPANNTQRAGMVVGTAGRSMKTENRKAKKQARVT